MLMTANQMIDALMPSPARTAPMTDIIDALAIYRGWYHDAPPVNATGDTRTDRLLASAFHHLASMPDHRMRWHWLCKEAALPFGMTIDDSLYRAVLRRWALTIHDERYGNVD